MNLELLTRRALINLSDMSSTIRRDYYRNQYSYEAFQEKLKPVVAAQSNLSWYLSVLEGKRRGE